MSIAQLAHSVRSGERSAVEVAAEAVAALEKLASLNLVTWMDADMAAIQARGVDNALAAGRNPGLLAGVPVCIKDNLAFAGAPLECCSPALRGHAAVQSATVVERLMDAGAVIVARTNMDEFAMGSSTETSMHGPARNPRDPSLSCGGSSGGSAGVVAAGAVPLALGSSTGGSVCQPASHCGVVGLEPTWGRLSRNGLVAFASSMDRVGLFTRTVEDAALVLSVLEGPDPLDPTSLELYEGDQGGLRVGLLQPDAVSPSLSEAVRGRVQRLPITEVQLPLLDEALACYTVLSCAEASSTLARYDGVKYGFSVTDGESVEQEMSLTRAQGFGAEVKRRILIGTYALSAGYYDAYYLKAQKVRTLIRREFESALTDHDLLLTPTTPSVAFRIGEKIDDPYAMYLNDLYTLPVNIAGNPGISIPCGFDQGLPVGLQLIGRPFDEATLLRATHGYQSLTDWHQQAPPLPR